MQSDIKKADENKENDENEKFVDIFCKDPTKENFWVIDEDVQYFFYRAAHLALYEKKGNIQTAFAVYKYYLGSLMSNEQKIGIKAVMRCLDLEIEKISAIVVFKDRKVYISKINRDLFEVELGQEKSTLNKVYLISYFLELLVYDETKIEKIILIENGREQDYFDTNMGIIYNDKQYVNFVEKLYKGTATEAEMMKYIDMIKKRGRTVKYGLTEEEVRVLYESKGNIKKRSEIVLAVPEEPYPFSKPKEQYELVAPIFPLDLRIRWECAKCLSINKKSNKYCPICEHEKWGKEERRQRGEKDAEKERKKRGKKKTKKITRKVKRRFKENPDDPDEYYNYSEEVTDEDEDDDEVFVREKYDYVDDEKYPDRDDYRMEKYEDHYKTSEEQESDDEDVNGTARLILSEKKGGGDTCLLIFRFPKTSNDGVNPLELIPRGFDEDLFTINKYDKEGKETKELANTKYSLIYQKEYNSLGIYSFFKSRLNYQRLLNETVGAGYTELQYIVTTRPAGLGGRFKNLKLVYDIYSFFSIFFKKEYNRQFRLIRCVGKGKIIKLNGIPIKLDDETLFFAIESPGDEWEL